MKCRNFLLLLLILWGVTITQGLSQSVLDSLLQELNKAISNKEIYVQKKLDRIEVLKNQLHTKPEITTEEQFDLYNKLFHEYKVFIYDSAFKYARKLQETSYKLADPAKIGYSKVKLCFILVSSGMYKETFDSLKTINIQALPDSSKLDCYWLKARAHFDLGMYDGDPYYNQTYIKTGLLFLDSALQFCKPNTYQYFYISNYKDMTSGDIAKALAEVNYLLEKLPLTSHQRAINSHHLGSLYTVKGETDKALAAFMVASICDIQAAVKENAALNNVADLLYKKGDVKVSYGFIEEAMKDALYYGAKQRKIEIGSILPIIAAEELRSVESQRTAWLIYSSALTVLGILVLVFLVIIVRQVKKLKTAEVLITNANHNLQEINHQLREADKIKEEYIGYYFNINSDYIDKIEDVLKAIDQKLMARKFDDIRFIVNNINLKREREELFVSFDKVFLKLFPDFVTTFNSYFKEENRIVLKDNQLLNTELRIFALIRMGINDTEKIARILDYSVNTIYTYKTKVKSKSTLPNEEFEKKIMEIMTV
jgi:tetratricopeptide (TPR) repeat protein